jgi:hypothetical protein
MIIARFEILLDPNMDISALVSQLAERIHRSSLETEGVPSIQLQGLSEAVQSGDPAILQSLANRIKEQTAKLAQAVEEAKPKP